MKTSFIAFLLIAFLFSCQSKHQLSPKESVAKIVAVYLKRDRTKVIDVMLRQITKTIKYDSAAKSDRIAVDTLWGYSAELPIVDKAGKPILDSLKNKIMQQVYVFISKDSVNWHVENIPIDSLLKR